MQWDLFRARNYAALSAGARRGEYDPVTTPLDPWQLAPASIELAVLDLTMSLEHLVRQC